MVIPANPSWYGLERPIAFTLILGSAISLATTGVISPLLILSAITYWSVVPLVHIFALWIVWKKSGRAVAFPRAIDTFFAGFTPWTVWLIGFGGLWALPFALTSVWLNGFRLVWLYGGSAAAAAMSLYSDYRFFRFAWQLGSSDARRLLIVHRCITWPILLLIIGAPTIWSETTGRIWL